MKSICQMPFVHMTYGSKYYELIPHVNTCFYLERKMREFARRECENISQRSCFQFRVTNKGKSFEI